jgi:hypothetical protein
MSEALAARPELFVPSDVRAFAAEKEIDCYLAAVGELAQRAFPSSGLAVSLGQDAEDDSHRYIALDVDAGDLTADELLAGQRVWSEGIGRVCPPPRAVHFVLGWR